MNNTKQNKAKNLGFTIVELLVVIVVIGILASITIVSYGGVTNKAYKATAQNAADSVASKAMIYAVEDTNNFYPKTYAALSADTTKTYYLAPATATLVTTTIAAAPAVANANSINIQVCGATDVAGTAPTTAALTTKPVGLKISYWDYSAGSLVTENVGNVATGAGAVTIGSTAYTTACNLAQS